MSHGEGGPTHDGDMRAPAGNARLRALPGVDTLLSSEALAPLLERFGHALVVRCLRAELADTRRRLLRDQASGAPSGDDWAAAVRRRAADALRPRPRPVINATGVPIHTNLGRVPLATAARAALEQVSAGYCDLEYDLPEGSRGSRHHHVVDLLGELTGAEDALVVNNNAAAVLLVAAALGGGGEVIVSRGELVEIGGSFRIPDVIRQGGARLVEVGTTNRTHLEDYAAAIGPDTRLLLKVHRSNFTLEGFTAEVSTAALTTLAHEHGLLCAEDLGSGSLVRFEEAELRGEPTVQQSVSTGLDLVCFSGDKLVGGPQAGLIVGRSAVIDRLRGHPLLRAVRPCKLTLAALGATLALVRDERARTDIPVLRMLLASADELRRRSQAFAARLTAGDPAPLVELRAGQAPSGGGAMPGRTRPVTLLLLRCPQGARSAATLHAALRAHDPPVVARVVDGQLAVDLRCVEPSQEAALLEALLVCLNAAAPVG